MWIKLIAPRRTEIYTETSPYPMLHAIYGNLCCYFHYKIREFLRELYPCVHVRPLTADHRIVTYSICRSVNLNSCGHVGCLKHNKHTQQTHAAIFDLHC